MQADYLNHLIRVVIISSGLVTTLAGGNGGIADGYADGLGTAATFNYPEGVSIAPDGSYALVVRECVLRL